MGSVHSDREALAAMANADPDEPVVMLNLLRYREQAETGYGVDGLSGREAYEIYGKRFAELFSQYGGEPIWMGRAHNSIIGAEEWDIVILVRYPTRRQFVDMFNAPEYLEIAPIRAAALADSRLIEMSQLLPRA